ncbi:MAG: hypothetical protein UU95_C0006G0005 [Parcubacteria group bacterium GW2011_GWC2_42_12]|nr:MAG: hypothetical protein UU95_C0006G0005 [Parcubacteria group bacterium GW2011_GWC2_42_12]
MGVNEPVSEGTVGDVEVLITGGVLVPLVGGTAGVSVPPPPPDDPPPPPPDRGRAGADTEKEII